jgi:hypothetical protein
MKPELTYEAAHAAAWDVGVRHARAAGRTVWTAEDINAAAAELNRLWPHIESPIADGIVSW